MTRTTAKKGFILAGTRDSGKNSALKYVSKYLIEKGKQNILKTIPLSHGVTPTILQNQMEGVLVENN